jgi:hypothetical protein
MAPFNNGGTNDDDDDNDDNDDNDDKEDVEAATPRRPIPLPRRFPPPDHLTPREAAAIAAITREGARLPLDCELKPFF